MKIKITKILALALFALCSCESRKDVYLTDMPESGIKVYVAGVYAEATKDCIVSIPQGRKLTFGITCDTDSLSEYRELEIFTVLLQGDENPFIVDESELSANRISVEFPFGADECSIKPVLLVKFVCTDYYGRRNEATLTVNGKDAAATEFSIKIDRNSAMDYTVTVEPAPNADMGYSESIVAYEYVFDGELCHSGFGMEGDYEELENPNPGHAARYGRYIISTSLPKVNHRFQTAGIHEVAVRVKNDIGVWSAWKTENVYAE